MADKILLPDTYKNVPLTDFYVDDFYEKHALWTATTSTGSSTAGSSIITLATAATNNDYSYLSTGYGMLSVSGDSADAWRNGVWEMTVRFKTNGAAATSNFAIGWLLSASVGAGALVDDGGGTGVASGAFCGIYSLDGGSSKWILCAQGASETRQTKTLDWAVTNSSTIFRAVRLRLERIGNDMKLFVFNDINTDAQYPEQSTAGTYVSRNAMNNFAPVRGFQDPPQVPFAYLENITVHAGAHSVFMGCKAGTAAVTSLVVDYIALAKTRAT